jgi:hypothetical protein
MAGSRKNMRPPGAMPGAMPSQSRGRQHAAAQALTRSRRFNGMGALLPIDSHYTGGVSPIDILPGGINYTTGLNLPQYNAGPAVLTVPLPPLPNPDIGNFGVPSAIAIPPGSYQLTSQNVYVDGNGYLYATCQRIDGTWMQSPPLYYLDCVGDITNINGTLTCSHSSQAVPGPAPTPAPVATAIDPTTGQVYTGIPASGPQPPGAGFQQVEAPGSTYPYVFIGGGSQPATVQNPQGQPYSVYVTYNPGDTVTYQGITWQAQTTIPPGVYPGLASGYWQEIGASSPYGTSYYPSTAYTNSAYNTAVQAAALASSGAANSGVSSFSAWFSQYKWWVVGGLAGLIIVPRVLKSR